MSRYPSYMEGEGAQRLMETNEDIEAPSAPAETSTNEYDSEIMEFYNGSGWCWQMPIAKDKVSCSHRMVLYMVWVAHYLCMGVVVFNGYMLYLIQQKALFKGPYFGAIVGTLFEGIAIMPFLVMHEYEGWQIAPYHNPDCGTGHHDHIYDRKRNNNNALRETCYKLFCNLMTVGAALFIGTVEGIESWDLHYIRLEGKAPLAFLVGMSVLSFMLPRAPTTAFKLKGQWVCPFPLYTLVLFILSLTYVLYDWYKMLDKSIISSVIATPFIIAGVFVEAVLAESTFNQIYHLGAPLLFDMGLLCQSIALLLFYFDIRLPYGLH